MDIGIIIGAFGLILSIGIALWQNSRARKAEAELNSFLRSLPSQVFDNMSRFLQENQIQSLESNEILDSEKRLHARYADLNGDGQDELIVQYPIGAHGSALQVFGFEGWEFKLIAELSADTPAGFYSEDIDGDGRLEVITGETSGDHPYVLGLRDEVWYRLEGDRFIEVNRKKLYESHDVEQAYREINEPEEGNVGAE